MKKAVITGIGLVTPCGNGKDATWEAVKAGKSGIRRITKFDPSRCTAQVAGEVRDFETYAEAGGLLDRKSARHMGLFTRYAVAAAVEAWRDAGYGATSDAYHITAPDPSADGAVDAITTALSYAGIPTGEEVDYVNAHGTSTKLNDAMETKAFKRVFGDRAGKVKVSSTKSMTGHLLGAAGAVEAAFCALAISEGFVPPTINYETPDPECDLDYTPNTGVSMPIRAALSTSLGFGGHNGALVFRKV